MINKYMEWKTTTRCHLTSTRMVVLYPKEEMVSERCICAPSPAQWGPNGNRPRVGARPSMEAKKITHQDELHRYCVIKTTSQDAYWEAETTRKEPAPADCPLTSTCAYTLKINVIKDKHWVAPHTCGTQNCHSKKQSGKALEREPTWRVVSGFARSEGQLINLICVTY